MSKLSRRMGWRNEFGNWDEDEMTNLGIRTYIYTNRILVHKETLRLSQVKI